MLITVSGMVGSGKTTAAGQIQRILEDNGRQVVMWRFQSLPCFSFLRRDARKSGPAGDQKGGPAGDQASRRWTGYRRRKLTLRAAAVYGIRIVAFRAYHAWKSPETCVVNRYFYDNFAHYELRSSFERALAAVLKRAIPVPDLAILVVASRDVIVARRPQYSPEYVSSLHDAYGVLAQRFSELTEISTDPDRPAAMQLRAVVEGRLKGS